LVDNLRQFVTAAALAAINPSGRLIMLVMNTIEFNGLLYCICLARPLLGLYMGRHDCAATDYPTFSRSFYK
jgi:hypothetical protein